MLSSIFPKFYLWRIQTLIIFLLKFLELQLYFNSYLVLYLWGDFKGRMSTFTNFLKISSESVASINMYTYLFFFNAMNHYKCQVHCCSMLKWLSGNCVQHCVVKQLISKHIVLQRTLAQLDFLWRFRDCSFVWSWRI